ncbi:cathepsin L1-like [Drosophila kikkawai]|uniref:cathepsin L n=1 Tax=Drosophila kikkawai TaxID=30033 RepID=A0A6P4IS48_DROKI|nr:cathepsin L-like [Drosophila kikkawai]
MSQSLILALLALLAASNAASVDQVLDQQWRDFTLEHRRIYQNAAEERFRLKVFSENRNAIIEHNQRFAAGKVSFKLAINEYADLTSEEFNELMNGFNFNFTQQVTDASWDDVTFFSPEFVSLPSSVDWRSKGAVTPVKNQKQCGSCWAFASTGTLEGLQFRKTGKLVALSEQNLVDCSTNWGNQGCQGGFMTNAFNYIRENGGIDTEVSYPYKGINDKCKYNKAAIGATVTGFRILPKGDENKLADAVANIGPISVAINASPRSFQFYSKGVYNEPACDSEKLNHGVTVVGYGREAGKDYWLVKNSWGTSWGDKGYIKMLRNGKNQCGISTIPVYPTL